LYLAKLIRAHFFKNLSFVCSIDVKLLNRVRILISLDVFRYGRRSMVVGGTRTGVSSREGVSSFGVKVMTIT